MKYSVNFNENYADFAIKFEYQAFSKWKNLNKLDGKASTHIKANICSLKFSANAKLFPLSFSQVLITTILLPWWIFYDTIF